MKRLLSVAVLATIPLALFAQAPVTPERRMLQQMGLTDAQVSQVIDIQSRTRDALRQSAAQARLLRAQIEKVMVAPSVDMPTVNGLVDQLSAVRGSMQKTLLAARAQLQQIMGLDNYGRYRRAMRIQLSRRFGRGWGPMRPGSGWQGDSLGS